ncbi:MAG: transporter [Thermoanaerobaculia bacterium]|nr:transporter [Thermoanaerobaculia bacterium]
MRIVKSRRGPWRLACAFVATGLAAGGGAAQTAELVTDRPDQTESTATVPRRAVQIESGWLRVETAEERSDEVGATLVRVGLADAWELRLATGGWIDARSASGLADGEVGAKWSFRRESAGGSAAALLMSASVPVGDRAQTSGRVDPELRLAMSHGLTDRLGLGWNVAYVGASERDARGDRHTQFHWLGTAALGLELTPRLGAFVELFGEAGGSRGGPPSTSLDGGLTWRLRDNLQLDLAAGVGLSRAAPDRFVGLGLSLRVPR